MKLSQLFLQTYLCVLSNYLLSIIILGNKYYADRKLTVLMLMVCIQQGFLNMAIQKKQKKTNVTQSISNYQSHNQQIVVNLQYFH